MILGDPARVLRDGSASPYKRVIPKLRDTCPRYFHQSLLNPGLVETNEPFAPVRM
jgi:hypothetical protein